MSSHEKLSYSPACDKQRISRCAEKECRDKSCRREELHPELCRKTSAETASAENYIGKAFLRKSVFRCYFTQSVSGSVNEGSAYRPACYSEEYSDCKLRMISSAEKLNRLHLSEIQHQTVYAGFGCTKE